MISWSNTKISGREEGVILNGKIFCQVQTVLLDEQELMRGCELADGAVHEKLVYFRSLLSNDVPAGEEHMESACTRKIDK